MTTIEDNKVYLDYVYELAIAAGYAITEAMNLSEMALNKKVFEGIKYSARHEAQLRDLLMRKHHQTPHNKEK
jgi:hypothetical protein